MDTIVFLPPSNGSVSTDSGNPVTFHLTNSSSETLQLFWIDRSGVPSLYGTITNGQTLSQATISTHVWEVKSTDGLIDFKFEPSIAGDITVSSASAAPTFTDFSEHVSATANGYWSTAQGYGLINVAKSLGIADTGSALPLNGQSNNLALDAISAPSAWAAGFTGKGVTVAVIDVGIAANAEVNANIVGGYNFFNNTSNAAPDLGAYVDHPLGVAAIIAASHTGHAGADTMGVAPDASLLNVRVGSGTAGSSSDAMANGIHYAVDHGAKVICMPLESSSQSIDQNVADAVAYAYKSDVVVVVIGGNYGNYGATGPAMIAQLRGEAIDVGNFDVMAGSAFASSNQPGATPFPWVMASSSGYTPTAAGGYAYHQDGGTSFAGPYVAGLAALLFQQSPNSTAADIISKIEHGASIGQNTASASIVPAPATSQILIGTADIDHLVSGPGSDTINGGAGIDYVQYHGVSTNYIVTPTTTGYIVTDKTGLDGSDVLINVERLVFTDTDVALDTSGNAGQVYRLYQAAFDRAPEKGGMGFWLHAMDVGTSLDSVAQSFVSSAEFKTLFGATPTAEQLVMGMYHNVLHREPDAGGMQFWVDAMHAGKTPAALLEAFSESNENQIALIGVISHGMAYTPV
jgi:subtilisin family serine protease